MSFKRISGHVLEGFGVAFKGYSETATKKESKHFFLEAWDHTLKRISSHCRGYDSEDDGKDWRRSLKEYWSGFGRSDVIFF